MRLITTNIGSDTKGQQTRGHKPEGTNPKATYPKATYPKTTNRSGEGPEAQYWTPLTGGMCHNSRKGIRKVLTYVP